MWCGVKTSATRDNDDATRTRRVSECQLPTVCGSVRCATSQKRPTKHTPTHRQHAHLLSLSLSFCLALSLLQIFNDKYRRTDGASTTQTTNQRATDAVAKSAQSNNRSPAWLEGNCHRTRHPPAQPNTPLPRTQRASEPTPAAATAAGSSSVNRRGYGGAAAGFCAPCVAFVVCLAGLVGVLCVVCICVLCVLKFASDGSNGGSNDLIIRTSGIFSQSQA